ncbi:MAG: GntR family transcriptional regulator [Eubacterium sp.]|nr:GntR family transcriptional regulator [Eubacterium sp.]MBR3174079.1 GntR family transcriptional regulator [Eubacterium sp.]
MITINFQSRTPIYQQIYDDIVRLIALGVLKADTKLPTVRSLAVETGINPNTVSKAYKMLEMDGITYSVVGKGSFVSDKLSQSDAIKTREEEKTKKRISEAYKNGLSKNEIIDIVNEVVKEGK